jgi:hypothetical protein
MPKDNAICKSTHLEIIWADVEHVCQKDNAICKSTHYKYWVAYKF